MSSRSSALALAAAAPLAVGASAASDAFVPGLRGVVRTGDTPPAGWQGTNAGAPTAGEAGAPALSHGLLALGVVATGAAVRQRRAARTSLRAGAPAPSRAVAVPFLPEPAYRATPGGPGFGDPFIREADAGFDPLNYAMGTGLFDGGPNAVPGTVYYNFRESEIKHARFAMLASLGIFFERGRYELLEQLGFEAGPDALSTEQVDALPGTPTWFFPAIIGIQFLAEYYNQQEETDGDFLSVEYKKGRCPGDLNFDPLNLKGISAAFGKDIIHLHNAELKHGRLAMIAVTAYLFRELVLEGETFG